MIFETDSASGKGAPRYSGKVATLSLRCAANLESFAAAPAGAYLGGASWMHWCSSPALWGVVLWGRPSREDVAELISSLRLELADAAVPHASFVDASGVRGVDGAAFELLNAYVKEHSKRLSENVERLALVRPEGMAGAIAAGFYEILEAPYPVELFDTPQDAAAWLGSPANEGILAALAAAHEQLSSEPPIVRSLQALLRSSLETNSREAARGLALSERTLQRRLADAGTSFQAQLRAARIEAAKAMMRDTNAPLTEIALDCGFKSLQNFSAAFRRDVGQSPSVWRQQWIGAES